MFMQSWSTPSELWITLCCCKYICMVFNHLRALQMEAHTHTHTHTLYPDIKLHGVVSSRQAKNQSIWWPLSSSELCGLYSITDRIISSYQWIKTFSFYDTDTQRDPHSFIKQTNKNMIMFLVTRDICLHHMFIMQ